MSHASRVQARIRQLCCLGLGGEALMPAVLRELHGLIPSYRNTAFWADETLQLSNIYDENPDAVHIAPLYVEEFYNRKEREAHRVGGRLGPCRCCARAGTLRSPTATCARWLR